MSSPYSFIFINKLFIQICLLEEELGSSDESGKDWSDLEREAAEEDRGLNDFQDEYSKKSGSSGSRFNSSSSHKKSSSDKHHR